MMPATWPPAANDGSGGFADQSQAAAAIDKADSQIGQMGFPSARAAAM